MCPYNIFLMPIIWRQMEWIQNFYSENLKRRDFLRDLGVPRNIILKDLKGADGCI
jgi:hypothetical protein